mgnify:CR=1 FL=1
MTGHAPDSQQAALPPELHTDLPVGEILRRTRVHYGQSLEDAANYLRIRAAWLEALERGEIDRLPGRAYAIGYVRTYSEYLGLDGEKMIQIFKAQSGAKTPKPELHFPVAASESKAPNIFIILGSLAVLALVVGVWMALNAAGNKKAEVDVSSIPAVPADMQVAAPDARKPEGLAQQAVTTPAPAEVTTSVQIPAEGAAGADNAAPDAPEGAADAPQAAAPAADEKTADGQPAVAEAPAAPKKEITINVKERTWVEVRDKQGKAILSRILKPGEVFIVPESNYGLRLDTGNAAGLELLVNGQVLPPLGGQGDILRGLVLDGNVLMQKLEPAGGAR